MNRSTEIGEIAGALAKAQSGLGKLVASKTAKIKTKDKTAYSYTYANLPDALQACRETLNANGIAIVQEPAAAKGQGIEVRTMLLHTSGQWLESEPLFMPVSGGAQAVGSAITYARRYQLLALVGLAPEDDDGKQADDNAPRDWSRERPEPPTRETMKPESADEIKVLVREIAKAERQQPAAVWNKLIEAAGVDYQSKPEDLTPLDGSRVWGKASDWVRELGVG